MFQKKMIILQLLILCFSSLSLAAQYDCERVEFFGNELSSVNQIGLNISIIDPENGEPLELISENDASYELTFRPGGLIGFEGKGFNGPGFSNIGSVFIGEGANFSEVVVFGQSSVRGNHFGGNSGQANFNCEVSDL